ncbi:MAG TPA: hypothetical protein VGW40_05995 [Allosphingosinicella sp.]|nr:hypothetical protein [Allosphingosinicella sp.]
MRRLAVLLLLASCGGPPPSAAPDSGIACSPACTVERAGDLLTVRKADGGFRRLRMTREGGVVAADGAERAEVRILRDGMTEVAIGGDRFRLGPL